MNKNLKEIKENIKSPLRQATLVFLKKDNELLLAMKKRGFGVGKWNGSGGKRIDGESIKEAAIREINEEIGVIINNPQHVATLNFFFSEKQDWNQQVIVYLVKDWKGKPVESEEMKPQWFRTSELPYENMWEDDKFWLPLVLKGKHVQADFLFDENQKMIEKDVQEI